MKLNDRIQAWFDQNHEKASKMGRKGEALAGSIFKAIFYGSTILCCIGALAVVTIVFFHLHWIVGLLWFAFLSTLGLSLVSSWVREQAKKARERVRLSR